MLMKWQALRYPEARPVSTLHPPSIDQGLPHTAVKVLQDQDLQQVMETGHPRTATEVVQDQDPQQGSTGTLLGILSNIVIAVIPAAPFDQDATITMIVTDQIL